jgi:phage terminase large subunit-like protein
MISRAALAGLAPTELEQVADLVEQMAQARESGRVPWLCSRPDCDGSPHPGRPGPHARRNQRLPGNDSEYDTLMALAGRGFGKTRTGSEWAWRMARDLERGGLVGPTAADTRDIMVEGESGILACAPPTFRPVYEPSKRKLTYPNGAIQMLYSADEPDRLRGPQHHYVWGDELAAWRRLQYAWDMLQMGLRLGDHPQALVTTTPRPLPLIKALLKDPLCYVVRGSTYDNLSNLAPTFRRAVVARYEGTTLGRQELDAEILDDLPGALLSRAVIDASRVEVCPDLLLRVVAMDPAGTGRRDETGLVAGGQGADGHGYLTHDASGAYTPRQAATRAWDLFEETRSDVLVYEDNFGKGWVHEVLTKEWRERGGHGSAPLAEVHASAGKQLRAQPVVLKYEQGKVHHVGVFGELEDQFTTWIPDEDPKSPDRVDAAVHLFAFLAKRFDLGPVGAASPAMMLAARRAPGAR